MMSRLNNENIRDGIQNHSIYKEAMSIYFKAIIRLMLYVLGIIGIVVIIFLIIVVYEGKRCVEDCQSKNITQNCNDHCY